MLRENSIIKRLLRLIDCMLKPPVMKKIIIALVILIPMAVAAQHQLGKFSFYAQGGYMSAGYIKESALRELVSEKETQHHKCIILNAGLLIRISEKWRMGPAFTYDHFGTKHRSVEYSNLNYMLRGDRIWKETRSYAFYSGLSLGLRKVRRFEDEVETAKYEKLAYQIYLAGFELKVNRLAIDVNAGYGVSGILNLGLKYNFH